MILTTYYYIMNVVQYYINIYICTKCGFLFNFLFHYIDFDELNT